MIWLAAVIYSKYFVVRLIGLARCVRAEREKCLLENCEFVAQCSVSQSHFDLSVSMPVALLFTVDLVAQHAIDADWLRTCSHSIEKWKPIDRCDKCITQRCRMPSLSLPPTCQNIDHVRVGISVRNSIDYRRLWDMGSMRISNRCTFRFSIVPRARARHQNSLSHVCTIATEISISPARTIYGTRTVSKHF